MRLNTHLNIIYLYSRSKNTISNEVLVSFDCSFDEEMRLLSIRNSLAKTLRESDDADVQPNAEFDYTIAAVCEIPRHINLSEWFGQKSWNIYFKPNYRQFNIKSVFLRYCQPIMWNKQAIIINLNDSPSDYSKSLLPAAKHRRSATRMWANSINSPSQFIPENEVIILTIYSWQF